MLSFEVADAVVEVLFIDEPIEFVLNVHMNDGLNTCKFKLDLEDPLEIIERKAIEIIMNFIRIIVGLRNQELYNKRREIVREYVRDCISEIL